MWAESNEAFYHFTIEKLSSAGALTFFTLLEAMEYEVIAHSFFFDFVITVGTRLSA
jgi:hypothetical protein